MLVRQAQSQTERQRFLAFGKQIYCNYPYYRDSTSEIAHMLVAGRSSYVNHAECIPLVVEEKNEMIARAALIQDQKQKDLLMFSFFEARPQAQTAVDLLLDAARTLAHQRQISKIVIGLDAHLNYGLGFQASHFNTAPCFGLSYTPAYYLDYFQGLRTYPFVSYRIPTQNFHLAGEDTILKRIKRRGFTFRFADMRHLKREIAIYTQLNNLCFQNHLWWADRTFEEDWELFYPFRWFIRGENLIIAEKDGVPIGFLLWYPDFNQLLAPGEKLGVKTLLKSKLPALYKIDRLKIAEVGVLPEYQGTGVILGLFELLSLYAKERYTECIAGWVEGSNIRSKGFGLRWEHLGCEEYIKYQAFEVTV